MARIPHVIGGEKIDAAERIQPVYNPATGEQQHELGIASVETVELAIAAAHAALPMWRNTSLTKRADVFFNLRQLLKQRTPELAAIVTSEHGKVLSDAAGEIARGLENVEFASGLLHLLKGERDENVSTGIDVHSIKQPVGVVAAITPFNFPVMVPLWMIASAIACGNTVVLKPSERDPSASVFLADLFREAGLPDGVLNVVHGDKVAVDTLLTHKNVKAISFVGSTPIARYIYETAAANGKRVQALGGAKNHAMVMPDADLDNTADNVVSAAYGSAGERCMAISVVVAVGGVGDELVSKIVERVEKLEIGDGTDPKSEMGPLITAEAKARVESYVAGAEAEGGVVVLDGRDKKFEGNGFFTGISLIDHVKTDSKVYLDEIFGPVLAVVRVDTFEEGLELINSHQFGNGTGIFTRDGAVARKFEYEVEAGMVGINVPIPVPVGSFSFGGWKDSLFGDTHIYGPESINFYTRSKVVTTRWPKPDQSRVDLGFPANN
ncbi:MULTISPECIES: CoA-acylating methylmalonate-semialdehyde dehydrogenase [unclassified Leucobacter]|uniref:CoA-acylating methylmalonate-semialdehyde dehydrogenase n=1 Tax=unclassified Leucobacter TaxID=2621730 RepID=UPI00165DE430|nr:MULTISPECIES: CoA-acylating methylmalonate-semialdehyde dehydrogenase [unclassified Leucobacter]MBC9927456.1 CoA-acylating methylmalonate-semialdehyde dehydrogenase [Leucobacter sp. cx-169]MBC9936510.1 CoA-acylating methylmalonate-semialdehyde dehydrogenase [Leucobacter sp. cx-87]